MTKLHYWPTVVMVALFPAACGVGRIRPASPSFVPGFLLAWFLLSLPWIALLYLLGVPGAWARLLRRSPDVRKNWARLVGSTVAIWAYLALGILVGIYYGAVVVSVRGYNLYDAALAKVDSVLLFGHSVIEISHRATAF